MNLNSPKLQQNLPSAPTVAILLASFNGAKFLADQLQSISEQTYPNWILYASDDNSKDNTYKILEAFLQKHPQRVYLSRKATNQGYIANFLSLVLDKRIKADFFAFADQDDIWESKKLQRAISVLTPAPKDKPLLYCSRTEIVDEQANFIDFSPLFTKPPSFANALVQCICGGNTIVFNQAARNLIAQTSQSFKLASHDWWSYIIISGCGGQVYYDSQPSIKYRQHNDNLVGTNRGWSANFVRILNLFQNQFRCWNDLNLLALQASQHLLTPENKVIFDRFAKARKAPFFSRLRGMKAAGVYRQTLFGNLGLIVATTLKKV